MSKSVQRWTETDKEIIRHDPAPVINESLARDDSSSDPPTEQEDKGKLPDEVYARLRVFSTYPSNRSLGIPCSVNTRQQHLR